ncbi:MAG: hypothetical protein AB1553_01980 [Nitrospirota bacterium]
MATGKSKEMKGEEALAEIKNMKNPDFIRAFIEGDTRKTVTDAAEAAIKRLTQPKDGEVDKITEETADFKDGIQATKSYVTCEDVIKKMREEGVAI